MNKQQIFDKSCTHLSEQKCSTWSIDGQCVYLSPEGLKCTVGCLMSKEQLKQYGDYRGYVTLLEAHARQSGDTATADFLRDNRPLLEALQDAHDGDKCNAEEMRNRLIATTAQTFNLNTDAVAQIKEWHG